MRRKVAVCFLKQYEELTVSRRTQQRRVSHPEPAEPGASLHEVLQFLQYPLMNVWIADHTCPSAGFLTSGLELGFDQSQQLPVGRQQLGRRFKEQTQGNEGAVDDHQICVGERGRERTGREVSRVGSFHDHHPRILAQRPGELTLSDVDGIDSGCAVLQEAIGEATG